MRGAVAAVLGLGLLAPAFARPAAAGAVDTSRIVAIGGSITEIVYALGAEKFLVARDTTSVYPPEAMTLPDVGYMRQLSPEGVLSMAPSAVLALEGSGPKEAMDVLKKASVPLVLVPEHFTREGIEEKIRIVGEAIGKDEAARALADKVGADIEAAGRDAAAAGAPQKVLFVLSLQGGKVLAAGGHTAADGIITLAGAKNAVSGFNGYKQMTDEAIMEAAPDVILMMMSGGPGIPDADVLAHPALKATPAGRDARLVRMDGAYLLGFGPRTAGAIRDLAVALHRPAH